MPQLKSIFYLVSTVAFNVDAGTLTTDVKDLIERTRALNRIVASFGVDGDASYTDYMAVHRSFQAYAMAIEKTSNNAKALSRTLPENDSKAILCQYRSLAPLIHKLTSTLQSKKDLFVCLDPSPVDDRNPRETILDDWIAIHDKYGGLGNALVKIAASSVRGESQTITVRITNAETKLLACYSS